MSRRRRRLPDGGQRHRARFKAVESLPPMKLLDHFIAWVCRAASLPLPRRHRLSAWSSLSISSAWKTGIKTLAQDVSVLFFWARRRDTLPVTAPPRTAWSGTCSPRSLRSLSTPLALCFHLAWRVCVMNAVASSFEQVIDQYQESVTTMTATTTTTKTPCKLRHACNAMSDPAQRCNQETCLHP
ncbi:hypothetical protein IWX50DRAFT_267894 [Phyllosticta citricarpa]